jgi:signal peptidase I
LKRPWQKGDVVTLYCPKTKTTVTKRIIGIGGDTINAFGEYAHEYYYSSRHRRSRYLDTDSTVATAEAAGVPYHPLFPIPFCQQQQFTATATATTTNESSNTSNHNNNNNYYYYYYHYYTVPPNHVWLEGDNPLQSTDSRHYGPVSVMSLRGRVVLRLWPISSTTTIDGSDKGYSSNRMIDNKRPPPCPPERF